MHTPRTGELTCHTSFAPNNRNNKKKENLIKFHFSKVKSITMTQIL